ncbi:molybdopterin-dependent oxidoreductase [bacterium]|nr:molybdopterin-dependent oxidoreductase [bacterium]
MDINRRDFLKIAGAGTVATAGLRHFVLSSKGAHAAQYSPPDKVLYQVCAICSGGCAMLVHLKEGRIVEVKGNPDDQVAKGHLCVKGLTGYQFIYNPYRLKYPMKRTNPKKGVNEDPGWVKISWDEAFKLTAAAYNSAIAEGGPESILVVGRPKPWIKKLCSTLGTPNLVSHNNTCYTTHDATWSGTISGFGKGRNWTTDYAHSKYILSFGWDQPGKAKNMQAQNFLEGIANGAKVVIIDPRLSITASKADQWIPIKPGTDLAFALAMIHVIINEKLYDKAFVDNYTQGIDKLEPFIREYTPQWASKIIEVPAETITKVAREFATIRPSVIASHKRDAAGPNYANSWKLAHAQVILQALVGSLDRPGGHIFQRQPKQPGFDDVFPLPEGLEYPKPRKERVDGLDHFPIIDKMKKGSFSTLAHGILSGKPYPAKAAFIWKYNILSFPEPQLLVKALPKLDFMAVCEVLPSEMTQLADVVLPESMYLENGGLNAREYFAMWPQIALREPIQPVFDTKGLGDIVQGIIKAMGKGDYLGGFNGVAYNEACMKAVGSSMAEIKKTNGLWGKPVPFEPKTKFNTESGKIEMYSALLEKYGYEPLPSWQPKKANPSSEYPYYFLSYRKPWERMTMSQCLPCLMDIYPENEAIMHPSTAQKIGVKTGDHVFVASVNGQIRVKARVSEGIRPDCVAVDHGFGHWSLGFPPETRTGGNDGDLLAALTVEEQIALKDPGVGALMEDVCVKVMKA